uniref:hypothetical protein n=1 Tax=Agathobacter sp. TaxID=2021311 RepID=UPI0040576217
MTAGQLVKEDAMCDNRYNFYHPTVQIQIFHSVIEPDDADNCSIGISVKYDLQQVLPVINEYLKWLTVCKAEVTSYFQERLGEEVPKEWFESIEVLGFSFIFNNFEDYGATIAFGESILSDHIIEFDFEKYEIVDNRLMG